MTKVFSVVGTSKRGKTTLINQLTKILRKKGYTICVVKHTNHHLTYKDFDHEGKDTFTYAESGADEVWLTSPLFTYHAKPAETALEEIIALSKADFILTEGFKNAETKKIVIKSPEETIVVKGEVIYIIEGEYNPEEIADILIHS